MWKWNVNEDTRKRDSASGEIGDAFCPLFLHTESHSVYVSWDIFLRIYSKYTVPFINEQVDGLN